MSKITNIRYKTAWIGCGSVIKMYATFLHTYHRSVICYSFPRKEQWILNNGEVILPSGWVLHYLYRGDLKP